MLRLMLLMNFWRDRRGQDLIEYALMAAFVAVGAGVVLPSTFVESYSSIWSRIMCVLSTVGHSGA